MRGVTVPSFAGLLAVAATSLILVGGAAATGASDTPAPPVAIHLASLAPHEAAGPMTFQQISTAAQAPGELRNAQTGQCLRDPNASHTAGTPLTLASCSHTRGRSWWLP